MVGITLMLLVLKYRIPLSHKEFIPEEFISLKDDINFEVNMRSVSSAKSNSFSGTIVIGDFFLIPSNFPFSYSKVF